MESLVDMKVKFLGTGTSTGVPEIGCKCEVCTSGDIRDRRLRASVLICIGGKRILIDCGPDFRQQILPEKFGKIDAVLLTHEHYDHVGGIDDLRPFCRFGDIDIFTNEQTANALRRRIEYCFSLNHYPGVPQLNLHTLESSVEAFEIGGIGVLPINVMHYRLPIFGYRIGKFAYLTDVKYIPEEELTKLEGLDVLVISALREKEHISHLTISEALQYIERIAPQKAYLIHMNHQFGLHAIVQAQLPDNVFVSYDGLEIEI